MEEAAKRYPIVAWKTFTHFPDFFEHNGQAWWLDDHDPSLPQVGERSSARRWTWGCRRSARTRGSAAAARTPRRRTSGPAAKRHPEANFVIYHSGFEAGGRRGPVHSATANVGVNRLITSVRKAGIGPNENVFAELGSTWWYVMRYPTQAAHVLGKLLKYVGEDNVVWGTDCLFYGSPQDQIQALRSFHISEEFQERYGYPELTKEIKEKILGLNGAALYGVDPVDDAVRLLAARARADPPAAPREQPDARAGHRRRGGRLPCERPRGRQHHLRRRRTGDVP